jgi:transcriptional regulator GlxA family with amidase domain
LPNLPASRIATAAGFANARMFNRIFRSSENLRPLAFRRHL